MLGERYKYDSKPIINLTLLQEEIKRQIEDKIKQGHYKTQLVSCVICGSQEFETLSEKDRFGLPVVVVICKDCGLIQTNPRLTQDSFNEFYGTEHTELVFGKERVIPEWFMDEYFHGQKIYRYIRNSFPKILEEMFVLEIGCGAGGILAYFRDKGCQVFGMDLDADCIDFGRKNYNLNLSVGSLAECKLEKKPDIIIMSHILEHLLKPDFELSVMRSCIDDKGLAYIEVPGVRNMTYIHNDMNFHRFLQIAHTYHFSLTTLSNLMRKSGFEMIKADEKIKSLFKVGNKSNIFRNDYKTTMAYLRRLEILRRVLPITPFKIKNTIEKAYTWLLRKTGLYRAARFIYRKIIHRTEPNPHP